MGRIENAHKNYHAISASLPHLLFFGGLESTKYVGKTCLGLLCHNCSRDEMSITIFILAPEVKFVCESE